MHYFRIRINSVLVARNPDGKWFITILLKIFTVITFLIFRLLQQGIAENYQKLASETALEIANSLEYVGMLAVEFFISSDGRLIVNELAPRPS